MQPDLIDDWRSDPLPSKPRGRPKGSVGRMPSTEQLHCLVWIQEDRTIRWIARKREVSWGAAYRMVRRGMLKLETFCRCPDGCRPE